jgi:hypothetical protein
MGKELIPFPPDFDIYTYFTSTVYDITTINKLCQVFRVAQIHHLRIQSEAVFLHPSGAAPETLMVDLAPHGHFSF